MKKFTITFEISDDRYTTEDLLELLQRPGNLPFYEEEIKSIKVTADETQK